MRLVALSRTAVVVLLAGGAFPTGAVAQFGVAARASTLGIGAEVSYRASSHLGVRAGGNWLRFTRDGTVDEIDYEITPRFKNATALLDVFPFGRAFHVTGGIMMNGNEGQLDGVVNQPVRIGNTTYSPEQIGALTGTVTFDDIAPYLGLGFAGSGRVAFLFDIGVAFSGTPRATLVGNSTLTGAEKAAFDANVELEQMELQAEIDDREYLKYHPVISVGLRIRL
jgi:hypothetical protein